MDNDLEIFRKREERKKKKKTKREPEYILAPILPYSKVEVDNEHVCFLVKNENGEAEVFLTDGEKAECISTPPIERMSTPKEQSMLMNWQKPHKEDIL